MTLLFTGRVLSGILALSHLELPPQGLSPVGRKDKSGVTVVPRMEILAETVKADPLASAAVLES